MATLAVLRTNVTARLGLDNTVAPGDQTQIDYYANEAVRKVLIATQCRVASQSITPGASSDYTLATSILEIVDWTTSSGGDTYPLERVSVAEILRLRRATAGTGTPTRFYALAGHNTIMFYPTPGAADTFTTYYIPYPTEMSTGTHDPSNATYGGVPVEIHDCLEYYICWQMADMDDDASSEMGERYRGLYLNATSEARRHLRRKGGTRLGRLKLNPRRRLLVPHDPSADW